MRRPLLAVLIGSVLFVGASVIVYAASYSFTGTPAQPLSYTAGGFLAGWAVQVHDTTMFRGENDVPDLQAEHGADCSGPPNTHLATAPHQMVFQCNDHVMTALNGDYGAIYLTPPTMVDFSQGEAVITWDMSTFKRSGRDWPDITISNFLDSQSLPLRSDLSDGVDLQGPDKNSIVITMDNGEGAPNLNVIRNGVVQRFPQTFPSLHQGIPSTVNQAAVRQPMKLTISPTRVRFERLANTGSPAVLFFDRTFAPVSFRMGVVSLGHHSYSPSKECSPPCGPGTWHWDELNISPSRAFYIGRVDTRFTDRATTLRFDPAPADSYLRFSGSCKPVVNGQPRTKMVDSGHPEHTSSYLAAIPAGSTSATLSFTNDDWWGGDCHAKDFVVWSLNGGAPSPSSTASSSPTPTAQPSPTPSPTASSPTPTASPTITPTPSSTPSPSPSSTPSATASPTASPSPTPSPAVCREALYVNGVLSQGPVRVCP